MPDGLQKIHPHGRVPPRVQPLIPSYQCLDGEIGENLPGHLMLVGEKRSPIPVSKHIESVLQLPLGHQTASRGLVQQQTR